FHSAGGLSGRSGVEAAAVVGLDRGRLGDFEPLHPPLVVPDPSSKSRGSAVGIRAHSMSSGPKPLTQPYPPPPAWTDGGMTVCRPLAGSSTRLSPLSHFTPDGRSPVGILNR